MELRTIGRALLSVSDKTGLVDLARELTQHSVDLVSTGGTRQVLLDAGLSVRDVSELTGYPEMLDGRVKTLHPKIHGGILAIRASAKHQATLAEHGIEFIDLVVCNLYPFEATLARPGSTHDEIIENIDIGGPSMVRSAAKNYHDVAVVTDPRQYPTIVDELRTHQGALTLATRQALAASAFAHTAAYDSAVSAYFADLEIDPAVKPFPSRLTLSLHRRDLLRYGENPHQKAAFYVEPTPPPTSLAAARVLHGKELSFNNILDLHSAWTLVGEWAEPAACVIKHTNPCGCARADTLATAFQRAYEGDPLSAFGGILGFNQEVDEATAIQITEPGRFVECIIAPGYSPEGLSILTTRPTWKKSVRLLQASAGAEPGVPAPGLDYRRVGGGLLVQEPDASADDFASGLSPGEVASQRAPTEKEVRDLRFAWRVCKHVKSNAIVLAREGRVVGVGAGQMSRVDAVHLAARKAGERSRGSVLASDAFFPFRDNIDEAARVGVTAIVQPGGSRNDPEVIKACDEHGLALILTGVRHFRH
jgi:phosphoribosylaminoimidazolecarboxamide formyltransferase/IMP cyclohydrolase